MAGLLAGVGRVEPGEELAEQVVELLLPVGRQMGPHRRRVGRRRCGRLRRGGARGVGWCRTCGSSGGVVQALPAPRGQLEQRRHVDGNRSAGCRPTSSLEG